MTTRTDHVQNLIRDIRSYHQLGVFETRARSRSRRIANSIATGSDIVIGCLDFGVGRMLLEKTPTAAALSDHGDADAKAISNRPNKAFKTFAPFLVPSIVLLHQS
jgi:hypothetical protein